MERRQGIFLFGGLARMVWEVVRDDGPEETTGEGRGAAEGAEHC